MSHRRPWGCAPDHGAPVAGEGSEKPRPRPVLDGPYPPRERDAPVWVKAAGAMVLILVLVLLTARAGRCDATAAFLDLGPYTASGVLPVPVPWGETFHATGRWRQTEKIALRVADELGMDFWERATYLAVAWNESRGRPAEMGDKGCSWGAMQIGLGGVGAGGMACHSDERLNLPEPYRSAERARFLDAEFNLRAGALLLRLRGSAADPVWAAASYAGCRDRAGHCKDVPLSRLAWWLATGLLARVGGRS